MPCWTVGQQVQGAVSLKFKSSFLSIKYTSLGANLPPKSFSEMAPRDRSCTLGIIHSKIHLIRTDNINRLLIDISQTKTTLLISILNRIGISLQHLTPP